MSQCTCGSNWRDDYCSNHGIYPPNTRREHELEAELRELKHVHKTSDAMLDGARRAQLADLRKEREEQDRSIRVLELMLTDAHARVVELEADLPARFRKCCNHGMPLRFVCEKCRNPESNR